MLLIVCICRYHIHVYIIGKFVHSDAPKNDVAEKLKVDGLEGMYVRHTLYDSCI